jgi:hypothetical protein
MNRFARRNVPLFRFGNEYGSPFSLQAKQFLAVTGPLRKAAI